MAILCPNCGKSAWDDMRDGAGKLLLKVCRQCRYTRRPIRKGATKVAALPGSLRTLVTQGLPREKSTPIVVCDCGGPGGHVPYGFYCRLGI